MKQQLTPKNAAAVVGAFLAAVLLIAAGFRAAGQHDERRRESRMNRQRDREMGVPDLGPAGDHATEEEKRQARTEILEERMALRRNAATAGGR